NDVLAVYAVTRAAADRARDGGGPTLIEAITYRLGDPTPTDAPQRDRTPPHRPRPAPLPPLRRARHGEGPGAHRPLPGVPGTGRAVVRGAGGRRPGRGRPGGGRGALRGRADGRAARCRARG